MYPTSTYTPPRTRTRPRAASPMAGLPVSAAQLINVPCLVTDYFVRQPDPQDTAQQVHFGTSGHRGCAQDGTFNEWHVLAIAQAICDVRRRCNVDGPLFLGIDTHALSAPARTSVIEVLAANGVELMLAGESDYTPTPALSHAIVRYNRGRTAGLADGIVLTPSHNPPRDGGLKYNPTHGGPAGPELTGAIEQRANGYLLAGLAGVKRMSAVRALAAATTHRHDFMYDYIEDLPNVVDLDLIRAARVRMAVDPLGGAGIHYWAAIADRYRLDLTIVNPVIDPAFGFMTLDWDGKIRMDPSSPFVMQHLVASSDAYDVAFACDTDHDRHGIVSDVLGLMSPNQYLPLAIEYLLRTRSSWKSNASVGKSVVSTGLIDKVAATFGRPVFETPVGFKWFAPGLLDGSLGVCAEESAGMTFARHDGTAWTTDKDGITAGLLAAEIMARGGHDLGGLYRSLALRLGNPVSDRIDMPLLDEHKVHLARLTPHDMPASWLAGEPIVEVLDHAPGNGQPFGGLKVMARHGWFAIRPSGTEPLVKIYAESFEDTAHLQRILDEAKALVQSFTTSQIVVDANA